MTDSPFLIASRDISGACKRHVLVGVLGWQDIRQRYRRSALGPFWLTISMGVMIGTMGIVFGRIFKSPMQEFLPFLSIGIIFWGFISTIITEACTGFIAAESIIKQLPIPLFVHILRMLWRNIIIIGHNIIIFPLVLIAVGKPIGLIALLSIPGFILLTINLTWISLILAVVCTRYRDLPQIIASLIQIIFYLTPIIWMPKTLPENAGFYLLDFNPVYHLIEIVRAPLLGQLPTANDWIISTALGLFGSIVAINFYGTYKRRIAYWL